MKHHITIVTCWGLCAATSVTAQSGPPWRAERRVVASAAAAGDTTAYRHALIALQRDVGTTPRLATQLATAAFAAHDTTDGWRWLTRLFAMEIALDTSIQRIVPRADSTRVQDALRRANVAARRPAIASAARFRVAEPDLVVEDLGYDAPRQRLLITSVRTGGIRAIDGKGATTFFVPPEATAPGGTFALGIDAPRNLLWTTTGVLRGGADFTPQDSGRSALLQFDLVTGRLRGRFVPTDSGPHLLGDLTVGPDGTVYLSDAIGGGVYSVSASADELRALVPPGTFASPQTPALASDGEHLFVPDYAFGIAVIDLSSGRWHWLRHSDSLALTGIDGLYGVGHDLIAVQNGADPNRIVRLIIGSGDSVARADVLVRSGGVSDLNHATRAGRDLLFISRSGWDRVGADGSITHGARGDAPVIRRFRLFGAASPHARR